MLFCILPLILHPEAQWDAIPRMREIADLLASLAFGNLRNVLVAEYFLTIPTATGKVPFVPILS
jgi:hypothetical protein